MQGQRLLATFDTWEGEYGRLARSAPPNSFTGVNVVRYIDGSLGPRAGLKSLAPTTLGNGALLGLGWRQYATNGSPATLWYIQGTAVKGFNGEAAGATIDTYTGALGATSAYGVAYCDTINSSGQPLTYITIDGDKAYKLNHTARTVTALSVTGSDEAGGRAICIYGDRMLAQSKDTGNRVLYSAAGDFDTAWPAANYFDVGDGCEITALIPRESDLLIYKQDGSLWRVTGTVGVNHVLRRAKVGITPTDGPHEFPHVALMGTGQIAFIPAYKDYPAFFDGASVNHMRHLPLGDFTVALDQLPPQVKVTAVQYPDELLIVSGRETALSDDRALLLTNGIWTAHTFGTEVTGFAAAGPTGRVCITKDGAGGATPEFYCWETDLQRPAFTSDTFARPGDLSDTPHAASFTTAEWWTPDGMEVQVQRVIVDFRKWTTGVTTNGWTLTVNALGRYNRDGAGATSSQSWSEAGASASTSGVNDREVKVFAPNWGSGFTLGFSALVGVSIRSVKVYGTVRERQPRS